MWSKDQVRELAELLSSLPERLVDALSRRPEAEAERKQRGNPEAPGSGRAGKEDLSAALERVGRAFDQTAPRLANFSSSLTRAARSLEALGRQAEPAAAGGPTGSRRLPSPSTSQPPAAVAAPSPLRAARLAAAAHAAANPPAGPVPAWMAARQAPTATAAPAAGTFLPISTAAGVTAPHLVTPGSPPVPAVKRPPLPSWMASLFPAGSLPVAGPAAPGVPGPPSGTFVPINATAGQAAGPPLPSWMTPAAGPAPPPGTFLPIKAGVGVNIPKASPPPVTNPRLPSWMASLFPTGSLPAAGPAAPGVPGPPSGTFVGIKIPPPTGPMLPPVVMRALGQMLAQQGASAGGGIGGALFGATGARIGGMLGGGLGNAVGALLSNPYVAIAAAAAAAATALFTLPHAIRSFSSSVLEGNRKYAYASEQMAGVFNRKEIRDFYRDRTIGNRVAGSAGTLEAGLGDLKDSLVEADTFWQREKNRIATSAAMVGRDISSLTQPLFRLVNEADDQSKGEQSQRLHNAAAEGLEVGTALGVSGFGAPLIPLAVPIAMLHGYLRDLPESTMKGQWENLRSLLTTKPWKRPQQQFP